MISWIINVAWMAFYAFMWIRTARKGADRAWRSFERDFFSWTPEGVDKFGFILWGLCTGLVWPLTICAHAVFSRDGFWFPDQARKQERLRKVAELRDSASQMRRDATAAKREGKAAVAEANLDVANSLDEIAADLEKAS